MSLQGLSLWQTANGLLGFLLDPVVGWFSDRLTGRWGRRRPILAVCLPFAVVSFFMGLFVPDSLSDDADAVRIWYVVGTFIGTFDFSVGPNNAWGAELSPRTDERVRLFAWGGVWSAAGNLAGAALPPLLVHFVATSSGMDTAGATREAYLWFGVVVSALYVVCNAAMLLWLPEPDHDTAVPDESTSPVPAIIGAVQNRQYLRYSVVGMLSRLGPSGVSGFVFVLVWRHLFGMTSLQVSYALLVQMGASFLAAPLWRVLGLYVENRTGYILSLIPNIASDLAMALAAVNGGDSFSLALAMAGAAGQGAGNSGQNVFGGSIYADCIDYDELHSGRRREAQYDSAQRLFWYVANVLFSGLPYALFQAAGYNENADPNAAQPKAFYTVLRGLLLTGVVVDVAQVAVMWGYSLTRARHTLVVLATRANAEGHPAVDPLTGEMLPAPPEAGELDEDDTTEVGSGSKTGLSTTAAPRRRLLSRVKRGFSRVDADPAVLRMHGAQSEDAFDSEAAAKRAGGHASGLQSGTDHFWDWELRLAAAAHAPRNRFGLKLRTQVAAEVVIAIVVIAAAILIAYPYYFIKEQFWVFSALMNVVVAAAFLLMWSGFRWVPSARADAALTETAAYI